MEVSIFKIVIKSGPVSFAGPFFKEVFMKALISLIIIFITMPLSAKELYRDQQPLKLFCQISLIDKVKIELPNIDLKGTSYNCLPLKGDSSLLSKCNLWNDQFPI